LSGFYGALLLGGVACFALNGDIVPTAAGAATLGNSDCPSGLAVDFLTGAVVYAG
jgi:hypothetical protein